jgi:hypothetical protein
MGPLGSEGNRRCLRPSVRTAGRSSTSRATRRSTNASRARRAARSRDGSRSSSEERSQERARLTVGPATISATATVFPPTIVTEDAKQAAIETLRSIAFRVEYIEPTEPGGSWTVQAFDEAGGLVSMSEAPT